VIKLKRNVRKKQLVYTGLHSIQAASTKIQRQCGNYSHDYPANGQGNIMKEYPDTELLFTILINRPQKTIVLENYNNKRILKIPIKL